MGKRTRRKNRPMALHPAENRGYRELYASARQLADHWSALHDHFDGPPAGPVFGRGAAAARELLEELAPATARYGLFGTPAASGLGASVARQRSGARDRFLERNQAARFAVGDVTHVQTLLAYLARLSAGCGHEDLSAFAERWAERIKRTEDHARRAVAQLADEPDAAVEPLHGSPAGRAAQSVGQAIGTVGEFIDRQAARVR